MLSKKRQPITLENEYFKNNASEYLQCNSKQIQTNKMQAITFKVIGNEYFQKKMQRNTVKEITIDKFINISSLIMFLDVVTDTMRLLMTGTLELLGRPGRRRRVWTLPSSLLSARWVHVIGEVKDSWHRAAQQATERRSTRTSTTPWGWVPSSCYLRCWCLLPSPLLGL